MTPGFSPCHHAGHAERIRTALDECVSHLTGRLPADALVGVVLTGSFARGEGTVVPVGDALKVLGDFEFFVVFPTLAEARRRRRQLDAWGHEASARLAERGVHVDVEFGPIDADFFGPRARPSIFVHDLREHGKVLWGPPGLLATIPPFEPPAIPPEIAVNLIFNRLIEQLATWERLPGLAGTASLDAAYQRLKLTLDLAGSALAFAGRHTALYRRRPAEFARLVAETPSLAAHVPPAFLDELAFAARQKVHPDESFPAPPLGAPGREQRAWLRKRLVAAVPAVVGVLRWELGQLLGHRGDLEALLEEFLHRPPLARRVKDWAKFLLNPMPAPRPVSHTRAARLFWTSTPRGLLYVAGARAYAALGDGTSDPASMAHMLPVPRSARPRDPAAERQAIVALWQWCVRNA
jgi:hypothetical protein